MRLCLRILLASAIFIGPAASFAAAATVQDLVKLKAAGLSDDILIALIESDGSVFHLKADDVIAIRRDGLSEKVILAMLATATKAAAASSAARPSTAAAPTASRQAGAAPSPFQGNAPYAPDVEDASSQITQITQPQVPAPVVINITQKVEQRVDAPRERESRPVYTTYPYYVAIPVAVRPLVPVKTPEPVYWGFGGQRRPDTWKDK